MMKLIIWILVLMSLLINGIKTYDNCQNKELENQIQTLFHIVNQKSCQKKLSLSMVATKKLLTYTRQTLCPLENVVSSSITFDPNYYLIKLKLRSRRKTVYNSQFAYNQNFQLCGFQIDGLTNQTSFPVDCAYQRQELTPVNDAIKVPNGFKAFIIGNVPGARGLVALPNGDLLIGTGDTNVYILSNADGIGTVGSISTFATFPEQAPPPSSVSGPQSIALGAGYIYASTEKTIWRMSYKNGQKVGIPKNISSVRSGEIAPNSDGDVHRSTSVTVSNNIVYAAVGSSCDACVEIDPTRATIQMMELDGSNMQLRARRWRNPLAFAVDPKTNAVWAGGAGQDTLPAGHPFEFMDPFTLRSTPADYGWPVCEEDHVAYTKGANCSGVVIPALVFPAYSTIIGATFYPLNTKNLPYGFPPEWLGGLFVSIHGSWHRNSSNVPWDPPHVAFVPFNTDTRMPKLPVDWNNPYSQWTDFFTGFQDDQGNRIGRCAGAAVGPKGSLFIADDDTGNIYRIRPTNDNC